MTPVEKVLDALERHGCGPKQAGKGWTARCPSHDDRRASLSIGEGEDGRVLLHCFAGCAVESICAAVGLRMADLMPKADALPTPCKPKGGDGSNGKPRRIVAVYDYRDESGNLVFQVVRFEPKECRQRRPDGRGGWTWNRQGVRVIPYRLPELLAEPARPVLVVEGEKDVDALARIGFLATCNAGGAGKWTAEHAQYLRGRRVFILPDNDEAGRSHARKVAQSLHGIAEAVRIVELPGLPPKGDVSDWIAAGGTKAELMRLAEAAPIWTPSVEPWPRAVDNAVEAELLDSVPHCIRRPLCLNEEHAYAAAWPWIRRTVRRSVDRHGRAAVHDPPAVEQSQALVIVRDDGVMFSEALNTARPLCEIGAEVHLPEIPPPDRTWSGAGVRRYLAGDRPSPADVFARVVGVVNRFMDFQRSLADQDTMAGLCACFVLSTYLLDAFNVAPYLWPNGDRGAGKTNLLVVVTEMAYLGAVILSGGSYASLRDLADYGATLAFDDCENLTDPRRGDPEKRTLLLAGNRRGSTVTFKEPAGKRGWITRHVHTFCARLFSSITLPDPVLASRTITIPLLRSGDPNRAKASPLDHATWPCDRRRLIDDLWAVSLANLKEVRGYDETAAWRARLSGRNLEPWRGILAVALWLQERHGVTGLYDRLEQLSIAYQSERAGLETADPARLLILALQEMARGCQNDTLVFDTTTIVEEIERQASAAELTSGHERYTNPRRVGRLLERLRFEKAPRISNRRCWRITKEGIESLARNYGVVGPEIINCQEQHGTLGTLGNMAGQDTPNGCQDAMSAMSAKLLNGCQDAMSAMSAKLLWDTPETAQDRPHYSADQLPPSISSNEEGHSADACGGVDQIDEANRLLSEVEL